ncbi:MAG: SgcJ/EcaC family oxidoreductase [Sphingomonadaceae bacterium]
MKTIVLTGLTTLAALGLSTSAYAKSEQCAAVTKPVVEGWFTAFNNAWATKDPDKVTALFARDAVLLPTVSNKPRTTPSEVKDYFVKFLKGSPVGTIDTSTIKMGCNSVSRLGTWTVALTNPETGAKSNVKARYSFIYKREGGQWKIDHLHSSVMPEPIS